MPTAHSEKIIHYLWSLPHNTATHLYVVLDGARNQGIYPAVLQSGCPYECLYAGALDPELAEVAPYLVQLTRDTPFVEWLVRHGWGDSWGIFIQSEASLRDMKRHFKKFAMVYDEDVTPIYFRYYDPRVLRLYLPTCDAEDLAIVFGPVTRYLFEDQDSGKLLQFSNAAGGLEQQAIAVETGMTQ